MRLFRLIAFMLAVTCAGSLASASMLTFVGSSGTLSARATFDNSATGSLKITLENIGSDVLVPSDLLNAIFFDDSGGSALNPVSAVVGPDSKIWFDGAAPPATDGPGTVVGGEWAYETGLSGAPGGANSGISSAGYDLFGSANFPGEDLDDPEALNGDNYALTSAVDDLSTGNPQVTGGYPIVKNSVVFTLGGFAGDFDLNRISNVSFQYGTSLTEPNVPGQPFDPGPAGVPEAGAFVVWSFLGAIGLCLAYRRSRS